MKITWFGHSCFRVETGGSVVLIDPFLKGNASFEGAGLDWEDATSGVTHVALTHGHYDHVGDTVEICKQRNATLFAVFELAMHLSEKGVEKFEPMNTGGTVKSADFDLTFVQALHSSSLEGVYLGNPCGVILSAKEGKTLYHMGDTDIFGDMALINELHKPDIGIVPIGDRFTMGASRGAHACNSYFAFKTIFPAHFGTFPIIDQTPDAFVALMKGQNVVVPKPGEPVTV
jgi:L-ascorbate metabolism protein UlaG (beta-lactamase superfamily)